MSTEVTLRHLLLLNQTWKSATTSRISSGHVQLKTTTFFFNKKVPIPALLMVYSFNKKSNGPKNDPWWLADDGIQT